MFGYIRGAVHALFFLSVARAAVPAAAVNEPLAVIGSTARGLEFEFVLDSFSLVPTPDGAEVTARGAGRIAQPGEPDLPGRVVLVGIPQEGDIRVSAEASDVETYEGVTVRAAPGFTSEGREPGTESRGRDWAEVVDIDIVRGVRVARIRLNAAQYDPARKLVRAARRLRVRVDFGRAGTDAGRPERFDPILEQALLNGAAAKHWKTETGLLSDTFNFYARSNVWCKVKTETTGVYRITPADLDKAGFSVGGVDPRTFKLYTLGPYRVNEEYPDTMVEVPVYVSGEGDGSFDRNDYIAFYAEATSHWDSSDSRWQENLFTRFRVFWLMWGSESGRRMETVSGAGAGSPEPVAPAHLRVEQDVLCPARSGLLWLGQKFFKQAGTPSVANHVGLSLPGRKILSEVRGRFYSWNPENETFPHYCRLYLNGVLLDSLVMTARSSAPPPTDFLLDTLPPGAAQRPVGLADTLTIEVYGDREMTDYLDYLEVRYTQELALSSARPFLSFTLTGAGMSEFGIDGASGDVLLFDVTDWRAPKRIVDTEVSGGRRRAKVPVNGVGSFAAGLVAQSRPAVLEQRRPGMLRGPAEQADYYVVCPDEFHAAARLFARYREGNVAGLPGARVRAVRLSDIYDDYTFGMEEPGAIQRFFAAKRPGYGLLAGDATYDYKNNLRKDSADLWPMLPAYEMGFDIDPEVYGQTAKAYDAWYADFEGQGGLPDMILGRITCRSPYELRRFLDKVRTYETQPLGFWSKRFILLADDEWLGEPGRRDPIGFMHITGCENIMLYTHGLLDPVKIYLTEYPYTGVNAKAGASNELLGRLNQGALFWCFYGHGAGFRLCHEQALNIEDVPRVVNGGRSPLAFFGSCGVGRFEDTRNEAIAEELVRKESGCIATFGATKATSPGSNELFARTLFGSLVENDTLPVGPSFYRAWLTYTIYHMFGDPGMSLRLPKPGLEPVVTPDTLFPGAPVSVADSVPVEKGMYAVRAHELDWLRSYRSEAGLVSYVLPGYLLHEGLGTFESGRANCTFMVPRLDYPDTVVVPNGTYVRRPNSGWVSMLSWDGKHGYASRRTSLPLGPAAALLDSNPPDIALLADGRPLAIGDTVRVPRKFTLTGVLADPSGILLASVPDYTLSLYIGARTSGRIDLLTRFNYDRNSATTGRFDYPLELGKELDSLTIVVSDNLQNRRVATAYVRTEPGDALRIESSLVYPNPVSGPANFTFELSRPALVTVKVFTISGRLVRRLPEQACSFGYNQVEWDGRDEFGAQLANGVYLYKLDARATEIGALQSRAAVRDKFIFQR